MSHHGFISFLNPAIIGTTSAADGGEFAAVKEPNGAVMSLGRVSKLMREQQLDIVNRSTFHGAH